ncbi:nucleotidyltransferase family protein [Lihuaxuella thermophila]|uniref:Molybdenum cofactor cytidylyltransferase n=1 Tax=Lihuaxuella thermophila TaxID=1173111 RepID=A0A1H8J7J9_9BACL|nr:nucleotidyltransferase family protein [Lihuaxuella thermophila]SEN76286.1 molybdenum cofactor cytidylyltransferase [Lihuaxuella thermophila]
MPNVGALILGAGMSKRMGKPKLLLSLKGKPLFRYAVETALASGLNPVILVGGQHVDEFKKQTADLRDVEIIANQSYHTGMSSSIQTGIKALEGRTDAAIIFLADQPLVPCLVVEQLLQDYRTCRPHGVLIVRPLYNGRQGHPVLFDRQLYKEFEKIQGDEGGKSIIQRHQHKLKLVSFENSIWNTDIDTYEDLRVVEQEF